MARVNGYYEIDDYKPICKFNNTLGDYCEGWYTDKNKNKLFKIQDTLMSYRELVYPRIIIKLGLPAVKNDLAKKKNKMGIISEDYSIDKRGIENIYDLMIRYRACFEHKLENNLEDLKTLLQWHCINNHYLYGKETEKEKLERFIIQILLGNSDMKRRNLEIYVEDSVLHFAPFYDFGLYGTIRIRDKDKNGYKLQYHHIPSNNNKIPAHVTIEDFLRYGTHKEIELFKEYLEKIKEIRLQEIFMEIREQTKYDVPKRIKKVLKKEIQDNLQDVESIMKGDFH